MNKLEDGMSDEQATDRCIHCSELPADHRGLPGSPLCPKEGRKPFSEGEWRTTRYETSAPVAQPAVPVEERTAEELLTEKIVEIAVILGITKGDIPLTGPHVLLLAADIKEQLVQPMPEELIQGLREFARDFTETMNRFGDWDDDCFYYNRVTASELQPLIRKADALLADKSKPVVAAGEQS